MSSNALAVSRAAKCADNYRSLRKKGITIRKTADVIIATFCIEKELPLLFLERDFIPFVDHLGLESAFRVGSYVLHRNKIPPKNEKNRRHKNERNNKCREH